MKKLLTILTLLMTMVSQGWAVDAVTTIYPANHVVGSWNALQIEQSAISGIQANDVITVYVSGKADNTNCQFQYINSSNNNAWTSLGTAPTYDETNSTYSLTITDAIATTYSNSKLIVTGENYTITKVTWTNGSTTKQLFPILEIPGWGNISIAKGQFANATTNDVIVAEFDAAVEESTVLKFLYGWGEGNEYTYTLSTDKKFARIAITESVLTSLNTTYDYLYISPRSPNSITIKDVKIVPTYQVSVTAENGKVYLGDTNTEYTNNTRYESGSTVTLRAVANEGYRFVNWTSGETILGTEASYTTPALSSDLTLTANFIQQYTVTAATEDANKGSVAITNANANNKYDAGSTITVTATPVSDSYEFDKWTKDGNTEWSSTSNPLSISKLSANWTLTAHFVEKPTGLNLAWTGTQALSETAVTVAASEFSSVTAGTKVQLTVNAGGTMKVAIPAATEIELFNGSVWAGAFYFEVTAGNIDALKANGIAITGSETTLTQIETSTYATGSITLEGDSPLPCGWSSSYASNTVTLTGTWGARGWYVGDDKYNDKKCITVNFVENGVSAAGSLKMEYINSNGVLTSTDVSIATTDTRVSLDIPATDLVRIVQVYFTSESANATYQLSSVEVEEYVTPLTLSWTGTQALSETAVTVAASEFASLSAGTMIQISASTNGIMKIISGDITLFEDNMWGYAYFEVTEGNLASLQSNGISITGTATVLSGINKTGTYSEGNVGLDVTPTYSWNASYESNIITFTGTWGYHGWHVGDNRYNTYKRVDVKFSEATTIAGKLNINYINTNGRVMTASKDFAANSTSVSLDIPTSDIIRIAQVFLSNGEATGALKLQGVDVIQTYPVTISDVTGGTISVKNGDTTIRTGDEVDANTVLTLTAAPDDTHNFSNWVITAGGATDNSKTNTSATYTVNSNVTIGATFAEKETVSALTTGESRTLFENAEGEVMSWNEICNTKNSAWGAILATGDQIVVTVSERTGSSNTKVVLRDGSSNAVGSDISIDGVESFPYEAIYTLTSENVTALASGFCISGDGIKVTNVALRRPASYTLTITEPSNGSFTVNDGANNLESGASVKQWTKLTLTATPSGGYSFSKWTIGEATSTDNPYSLTLNSDVTVTAVFEAESSTLTKLSEDETRTVWTSTSTEGDDINWNEYGDTKNANWGGILEAGEIFKFYVTSTTGDDRQIVLRDAGSTAVNTINPDVITEATVVEMQLTTEMVEKLANGFCFSGTGYTITKVELYKPAAVTSIFDSEGKADLSKLVKYGGDDTTYTYAEGIGTIVAPQWSGATLQLTEASQQVSGAELSVTMQDAANYGVYVFYTDNTSTDGTSDVSNSTENGNSVIVTLNPSKKIKEIVIKSHASGTNTLKLQSIVLGSTVSKTEKTLLSNSIVCGSEDEGATTAVPGYKFKNAVAGDEFIVHVSDVAESAYIAPKYPTGNYPSILGDTYSASVSTSDSEYRLSLTDEIITSLKSNGLIVCGKNLTIGIVSLYSASDLGTASQYTLTTSAANGTIAVSPEGTEGKYDEGTSVSLTATANSGYTFSKWTDGTNDLTTESDNVTSISENVLTITMNGDMAVTAVFEEVSSLTPVFDENGKADLSKFSADAATYTYADGKGTLVTGEEGWKGISVSLPSDEYFQATKLTVKFAEATSAYVHASYEGETEWKSGDTYDKSGTGTELILSLDHSKKVTTIHIQLTEANSTAVLTEVAISNKCTLKTSVTNGTITVKKDNVATTDTEFEYGNALTLTATPASSDYSFKQWVIGEETKTDNPYTFTITGDMEITAEFKSADENVIWTGSQVIDWNNGKSQTIAVTTENDLTIDDCLVFTITPDVEGIEWPQLQLSSKSEGNPVLIGSANTAIDENTTEVRYYVTKAMLNDISANGGFIVSGAVFTLSKVKIERGNGGEDYEDAIWIGEKTYPSDWSVYTVIGKDLFANAKAGQIIRIKYKDVKTGANMSFSYNDNGWNSLPDAASVTPSGLATKLTVTSNNVDSLKAGGLIISGVNFTLTSVDLLDASSVKELTGLVAVTGDDWVWTSSETPTFTLKIENKNSEAVAADAVLMIRTDKLADVTTLTQSKEIAANGSGEISFTYKPTTAGFYHATMILNDETVRAFFFGYAPTEITSPADKQSDFDSFWKTAKDQLATVEASDEPVLTEITSKSTSKRKVYLVEFKSVADGTSGDPVTVRGYYCEPTDGQKHPVIMHYLGYDSEYRPAGQDGAPYCPSGDANPDYAEFYLSTRGQSVNNRKASERNDGIQKDFTNIYGDWFAYNFGKKDSWYYRGAYMDCVRAIDFMATRSTSDMENLFAEGQSQGGALTYAAVALSGRTFKAIAPAITFMGDFPDYFELTNWPANVAKANQGSMTDAEMYAFLSYFDTKNLATKVNCPVITSIGVQDNVCPPHTNIAPYNNVTTASADKQIVFNPELQHATNSEWYSVYNEFFEKYNTWENPAATKLTVEEKRTLWTGNENLGTDWPAVASQTATVGGILEEGEKLLITVAAVAKDSTDVQVTVRSADYKHTLGFSKFDDFESYPAEVKLILSADDVEAFKNGFHITGKNCTITKAVLYKPSPVNRTERTLVEKKQAVGDGIEINRGLFSNAAEEDVLKVYFEVADGATGKINLEDMDYNGIENSWPALTTSPYTYTFTATALKTIQESGMRIRGENFTFLKATLYTEKELGTAINDDDDDSDDISNADASEETKKLYKVLKDLYGKKIVSGVVANIDWNTKEAENVYEWTGKWPALNMYDFINIHASKDVNSEGWLDYSDISGAKAWWNEGGVVGAMWHWQMKANNGTNYTCTPGTASDETSFDASKVYVDGTEENTLAKQQLDQVSGYLKKMQDAGIPVVWRPLHEAAGNIYDFEGGKAWFWWGAKGADVYKKLWQWMYDYMVKTKGLNNLIWVWTSQTKDDAWYPGNDYVDIIGRDSYGATAAQLSSDYKSLDSTYSGKMVALSECGNSDDAGMASLNSIWDAGCRWSWFMTWYDSDYNDGKTTSHKHTSKEWWTNAVAKDYVVTRDQMKELLGQGSSDEPTQTGVDISLDDLNEGWSSEYNAATKTITTTGEWAARGWYIGDDRYSSKGSITVKFEAVQFGVTLKMEYTNTSGDSKTAQAGAAAGETEVELDIPTDVKTIEKVYITYQPVGTLVLTEAKVNDRVVDNRTEKTLAEKSQAISDGDISINRGLFSNAAAKDVVRIYATGLSEDSKIALEPADYSGALDGANWTTFTESPFELKLTESMLATIKEKGLLVRGENYTFTKAVLYTESELGSPIEDSDEDDGDEDDDDNKEEENKDEDNTEDSETIFDSEGEADLSEMTAQDESTTTVTYNSQTEVLTITTTEPYKAAQIWFNNPEKASGNVLEVEIQESDVDVTVTVGYTDGTESSMSSTVPSARRVAGTRAAAGTKIVVPLELGKMIQKIEIKNADAGTINVTKMTMTFQYVFTNGKANLSMLVPQSNATYDVSTHTLATTKGWTGVTVSPLANENVSGEELMIRFKEEYSVKVAVKYRTGEEGPSTIMEWAATSVKLALDPSKLIQEIMIQPTTAAIITFTEIAVNGTPDTSGLLMEGKTLELWTSEEGEPLTWNEIAHQKTDISEQLQEFDEIIITVASVAEGNEWPKVFLRDVSSNQVGKEVLLNEVTTFPYEVRIVLTNAMAEQLKNGFSICGDGVTVTRVVVYRPVAPKKGDIHLRALDYGYDSSYDAATYTITTTSRWAARGWEIGDDRYNIKDLIVVQFEAVDFPVTLKMEYVDAYGEKQATSAGVAGGNTEVRLAIPAGIQQLDRVYIIYQNPGSLTLTEATVINAIQARTRGITEDSRGIAIGDNAHGSHGTLSDSDEDAWYTLSGLRVEKPGKGVYIRQGKKVVRK